MKGIKDKLATAAFAFKSAWRINKWIFLFWLILSTALSVFPAIALIYNREIISILSSFIATGEGAFPDIVRSIVMLGLIMTATGLSGRINHDLVFMMMYDSYYFGMEEVLMDKKQKIDLSWLFDKERKDELNATICLCSTLNQFMASAITLISKSVSIISILAVAYTVSPLIFAFSLAYVVIVLTFNAVSIAKGEDKYEVYDRQRRLVSYYQNLPQNPGLAKEVRIYESRKDIIKQWREAYRAVEGHRNARNTEEVSRSFVSGVIYYVFMAGVLLWSIYRVAAGDMKADVFLMLYTMAASFSVAYSDMIGGFFGMSFSLFELSRQRRLVMNAPERKDAAAKREIDESCDTVFEFRNVGFSYGTGRPVLENINFKIKKGEHVALVGYNGSGKTTLTSLMLDMYRPDSGEILFYGHPITEYSYEDVKKKIGVFFQDYFTFHASIRDNVGFGDVEHLDDTERILAAIKAGGAEKIAAKQPKGIDQWLRRDAYKDGAMLSGGEKQRIAVARAHMSEAPVMIFDEPAAALDPIAEMIQFENIRKKTEGKTSVLVSHRIGFARLADRIIVMEKGRIIEDGTHDELLAKGGTYAYFWNEQSKWYDADSKKEATDNG